MTKVKARKRAKARAAAKFANPEAKTDQPAAKFEAGKFDPKTLAAQGAGGSVTSKHVTAVRRGGARSR